MAVRGKLPSGTNIVACIQLCTSSEMLIYLKEGLQKKLATARVGDEYDPIMKNIDTLIAYTQYRESLQAKSDPFGGDKEGVKASAPGVTNYQDFVGQEALKQLDTKLQEVDLSHVDLVYNITDVSAFTRGYLNNGVPLDAERSEVLDNGFNSWLDSQGMCSVEDEATQDVIIYYKPEKAGNPNKKVEPQVFANAIEDKKEGPQQGMSKLDKSIQVNVQSLDSYSAKNTQESSKGRG